MVHQNLSTRWLRSDKARRGSPGVTIYWACRDDFVAPQADDRVDSGRDRGAVGASARRRRGPGRQRQHGERATGSALRQPQDRSGQCARWPGQGPRRRLDLHEGRLAGRDHRRVRELAAHPRLRRHRRLGLSLAAVGQAHRDRAIEVEDRLGADLRQTRRQERGDGAIASRRAGHGQTLHRQMVPNRRRRL